MNEYLIPGSQGGKTIFPVKAPLHVTSPADLLLHSGHPKDELLESFDDLNNQISDLEMENRRLRGLIEFNQQLQSVIDLFVAAQMAANALQRILACEFVGVFHHEREENRLVMLTAVGPEAERIRDKLGERWERFPHSLTGGLLGQAVRLRKIQVSSESDPTLELLQVGGQEFQSLIAAPLIASGFLEGAILLADTNSHALKKTDVAFVDNICFNLMTVWERIAFDERQVEIIKSISNLSSNFGRQKSQLNFLKEIAHIARESVPSRMTICALYEDPDWKIQADGEADRRLIAENSGLTRFLREILNSGIAIRMADMKRDPRTFELDMENNNLHSLLACPFSIDGMAGGVLVALGRENNAVFSEKDERLMNLLATNASVTVNRFITEIELNDTLTNLKTVHNLSLDIAKSRDLKDAIRAVALKAGRLFEARSGGLVLVDPMTGNLGANVYFPDDDPEIIYPRESISKAIETREKQEIPGSETYINIYPMMTQEICYGALWLELPFVGPRYLSREDKIQALIKQTAVALESSIRLHEISNTYKKLETTLYKQKVTWDAMIQSFVQALDKHEHETADHSSRIAKLSWLIGREMGFRGQDLQDLKDGALLHDIGKMGIKDVILANKGPLSPAEIEKMREHVTIGAKIVQNIPGMEGAAEIIANYHELWNGSGYPNGKEGQFIPKLARIVTVADVFDAMTNDRPYRAAMKRDDVLEYIKSKAGILYDPGVVTALMNVLSSQEYPNESLNAW